MERKKYSKIGENYDPRLQHHQQFPGSLQIRKKIEPSRLGIESSTDISYLNWSHRFYCQSIGQYACVSRLQGYYCIQKRLMRHNCPRQRRPTSQSIFIIDMINNWPYNHQILVTSLLRCVGSRLVAMCVHMLYEVSTVTASYGLFIQNRKMAKWRRLLLSSFICFFFAAYFLNY